MFTARKRSLGQGNVFTGICNSVHRGGLLLGGLLSGDLLWGWGGGVWGWMGVSSQGIIYLNYFSLLRGGGESAQRCLLLGVSALGGVSALREGVWSGECLLPGVVCSWGGLVETPPGWPLLRVVRILLECILVLDIWPCDWCIFI